MHHLPFSPEHMYRVAYKGRCTEHKVLNSMCKEFERLSITPFVKR